MEKMTDLLTATTKLTKAIMKGHREILLLLMVLMMMGIIVLLVSGYVEVAQ